MNPEPEFEEDPYPATWRNPNYDHEDPKPKPKKEIIVKKPKKQIRGVSTDFWRFSFHHWFYKKKDYYECKSCGEPSLLNRYAVFHGRIGRCRKCW